jgi:HEPN domain-containing protein
LLRKTDSNNPADWIAFAESDLEGVMLLAERELSYELCRSKLAEILEKVLKAELIRLGWFLVKTHELLKLAAELESRNSDLPARARALCVELATAYFADRYPGFDSLAPDWPALRAQAQAIAALLLMVKGRLR